VKKSNVKKQTSTRAGRLLRDIKSRRKAFLMQEIFRNPFEKNER